MYVWLEILKMFFAFGIAFEIPVATFLLIKSGIVKNYSTDVLEGDSSWTDSEFISNILYQKFTGDKKAFITPHVGGYAREAISQSRHRIVTRFLMEMDK